MARLAWADWRPDVMDVNSPFTRNLRNVIPRGDGYGPFRSISPFTAALPAACRGSFVAKHPTTGEVQIFAGTSDRLYILDNTTLTWTDMSAGGSPYTALAVTAQWVFAQFNNIVLATQQNAVVQAYDLSGAGPFAALAGSPPQAGWVAVVGRFAVLGDIINVPQRVAWSDVNDIIDWTNGSADTQDLPSGGRVRAIAEITNGIGLIFQDNHIRRMAFAPGSEEVFQIDKLQDDVGILSAYSLAVSGSSAFFFSTKGFVQMTADGAMAPIGDERVDRTFRGGHEASAPGEIRNLAWDNSTPQLVIGVVSPKLNLYLVAYKSQVGAFGLFDKAMVYHSGLKRWAPIELSGEYLSQVSRPGYTLEQLDAVAPGVQTITDAVDNGSGLVRLEVGDTSAWASGDWKTISAVTGTTEANGTWEITVVDGTHIDLEGTTFANAYVSDGIVGGSLDAMTGSLDEFAVAALPDIAAFDSSHKLGHFSGDTLEASLETPEQNIEGRRTHINGVRPITDAASVFGSVVARDNLNATAVAGDESEMDADGYCPLIDEGRFARGRIRIPATTLWNFAAGLEIDAGQRGRF